ncbi:hypothetical protein SDC9_86855 [bioreactor metagenome]|uniref:Ribosomal RNA small subunit methyltransferase G n=1 Tax=bioreactor metagenome TaxID=1076179 RepID=A0A644ZH46_9ZZZZ
MPLPDLLRVVRKNISSEQKNALPNGIICLKGGDLAPELSPFKSKVEIFSLSKYFPEPFFETKKLIYLPV